jgi:hypothetical protein
MLRFVSGFVMGTVTGTTLAGFAAGVFAEDYLRERSVISKHGAEACRDPYVFLLPDGLVKEPP